MGMAAGIGALGQLGAGLFNASAASSAANTQAQATQEALALQQGQYDQTRADLKPYRQTGKAANSLLNSQLPQLSSQFDPTEANLQSTPGYQFDLSQGLKSTQNSAAARGLGISGAALKGADTYATGLADNTLSTQFNIDQTNKTNAYNKLYGTAALGETAAAQTGTIGANLANSSANTLLTGAAGQSNAQIASSTSFNPLLNNLGNYYTMNKLGSGLYSGGNTSLPNNANGQLIGYGS